jgi:hypothetical protein
LRFRAKVDAPFVFCVVRTLPAVRNYGGTDSYRPDD